MSAEIVQIEYETVQQVGSKLADLAEESREMADKVSSMSDKVVSEGWTGQGMERFASEMEGDVSPALTRLHTGLDEFQSATLQAMLIMDEAEQEAAKVFDELVDYLEGAYPKPDGGGFWSQVWESVPGQGVLGLLNGVWGFAAGSGHEFGESYGPAAEAGSVTGDIGSSFLIYGDIRDLIKEGFKGLHPGMDANELTAILSGVGLVGDLGWLDGPIPDPVDGVNLGAASLKVIVKQLDNVPKPVQESLGSLIKWGVKNPTELKGVAELSQWMVKNYNTPAGEAFVEMMQQGSKDPAWFKKAADAGQWLKSNPDDFIKLAEDAAHNGKINYKSLYEAHIGASLKESKRLSPPVVRSTDPKVEFVDGNNVNWDIKSYNSKYPNGYSTEGARRGIEKEFKNNENVILDTTDMNQADIADLRNLVQTEGWGDKIIWFP